MSRNNQKYVVDRVIDANMLPKHFDGIKVVSRGGKKNIPTEVHFFLGNPNANTSVKVMEMYITLDPDGEVESAYTKIIKIH